MTSFTLYTLTHEGSFKKTNCLEDNRPGVQHVSPIRMPKFEFSDCLIPISVGSVFRIASDKKMHEVVVMSDVISRLSTSSKVDSVIDLVSYMKLWGSLFLLLLNNVQSDSETGNHR